VFDVVGISTAGWESVLQLPIFRPTSLWQCSFAALLQASCNWFQEIARGARRDGQSYRAYNVRAEKF
jgi:hypothetical protein